MISVIGLPGEQRRTRGIPTSEHGTFHHKIRRLGPFKAAHAAQLPQSLLPIVKPRTASRRRKHDRADNRSAW
jgi:hypothetical protein